MAASCYKCGQNGANYRRTVQTGYAQTYYYNSKRNTSSTRTYFGVRSICEGCAYSHDKSKAIRFLLIQILILVGLTYLLIH
ncbi:hypothetical protein HDF22_004286 [Mucilaginibacter lappiensis]|uniref:Uncharacterized protein n=1 Tax=Mucilaginibacter lappiensis TaxID=354630 RepID=A0A841JGT0_9SPHI|nr:hypothetical protein [Mucilaginibacter lappiensis]